MNAQLDMIWTIIGVVSAAVFCSILLIMALAPCLRQVAAAIICSAKRMPVRVALAGLALGALVSYAGTKPRAEYTVEFIVPEVYGKIDSMSCMPGKVYNLPPAENWRWRSSANNRLYDGGLLIFDLAKPGETVTMTAIWE